MKIRKEITLMFLVASVSLVGACASNKTPQPVAQSGPPPVVQSSVEKTTTSIQAVENDMKTMTAQIDSTNSSLNAVILAKGTPAGKSAFDTYSANVSRMEKAAAGFMKDSDQMAWRGTDYFKEWSKSGNTYTNPQIQRLSEQRRATLSDTFKQIADSSSAVKGKVSSYLSEINQVKIYLSNDLSRAGIDAVSPVAQKAIIDGQQIIAQVQPVITAAQDASIELGAAGSAAGGTSSPGK